MAVVNDLSLAVDFPQATHEHWLKLVEGMLKGADFETKLVARSHDSIAVQPLNPKADGITPVTREQAGRCRVSQRVDRPGPQKATEGLSEIAGGRSNFVRGE
jgi:methylmalonyl-CoA mutase